MKPPPSPLSIDYRKGSRDLSLYPPLRNLLRPCSSCSGEIGPTWKLNRSSGTYYRALDPKTKKEIKSKCSTCYDTGRKLSTLSSGDVYFPGEGAHGPISIGIEVKSISDLITSIQTGRLQDTQIINGMLNDYDIEGRWILHYGLYRPSPKDGTVQVWKEGNSKRHAGWYGLSFGNRSVPYSYVESFKVSPQLLELGFHVVRVNDIIEASRWIVEVLHKTWTRPYHTHKSMRTVDRSQDVDDLMRREMAADNSDNSSSNSQFICATLPGNLPSNGNALDSRAMDRLRTAITFPSLGYEKAKGVARVFSSIREMVNAGVKGWEGIEIEVGKGRKMKIGRKIADRIEEYLS